MKKFLVSVGLIAAGTASLQAAYAPDWDSTSASMWSVSGTLRGFYDDNYETASSGPAKQASLGFELSPQFELNVPLQQTELGMRYIYGLYYYQKREELGENPIDQTQQFDLWVDHAFTERWQARVQDSFVMGQEPELIDPRLSVLTRTEGNNIGNTGTLILDTAWTRLFSTALKYQNSFFDYQNSGATTATLATQGASYAGLLNRIDQTVSLDLQWHVAPETVAFFGGSFEWVNYTGDEPIAIDPITSAIYYSSSRNSRSYYGYVGVQRSMLANLSFTAKGGVQYTDNYNDPSGATALNPYADLSLIYTYLPGSYAELGFTQMQNATDQVSPDPSNGSIAMSTESSTVYVSINHKLTAKLLGTVIGQWQHSVYNQGSYNNQADDYYSLGVNLSYSFNQHFSVDAGYNYDDLTSKIPDYNYTRNRVYLGVTATY
ncbi:MAG: outer membrane beta-barrel protein [Limisphaerales bacterium]